ncbi:sensor histidine kinase [Streptomyces physcomitrii]|uniref:ATP-binding protein n=1 Tax=Streptomyces physcomitrii TaxID=2724184 RepID=UPI0033E14B3E
MDIPVPLVVALGVLALWGLLAAVLLTRARAATARARAETEEARREAGAQERQRRALLSEVSHLAENRVPALIRQLAHPAHRVPPLAHPELADTEVDKALRTVAEQLTAAVRDSQVRTDEAAQEVMRTVAGRVRTLAAQMEKILDKAQHDFGDRPEFTPVLYELDHRTVLMRRVVQAVAVVCGDAPGLARQDSYLADLVTAAQSRVESYGRIEITNHLPAGPQLGVAAPAAEALAMVLAELMDNAAYCTVGSMPVRVGIHRTAAGAAVVVSDSGPGLDTAEKQEFALRMLDTSRRILLTEIGTPPKLGFAAIGRLTRRHAIEVAMSPSATRGMEAVVHIDASLLVSMDRAAGGGQSAAAPLPAEPSRPAAPEPAEDPLSAPPAAAGPGGLPRRRRRAPAAGQAAPQDAAPRANDPSATRDRYAGMQASLERARSESPVTHEEPSR